MSEPLVRVSGLSKVFGVGETRVEAVRDVDFELARGEIVLVMGPSGSGKTTLLSMLGGLSRPTQGEIWVDGIDIAELSDRDAARPAAGTRAPRAEPFGPLLLLARLPRPVPAGTPRAPRRSTRHRMYPHGV
jgi:ABC-type branched-subunit amino acid transport system ATPase component